MHFNLDQFIHALSDAVDLVGVDETMHGKRVGCMAWHCAQNIGMDEKGCAVMLYLGLLHDCGVSTTDEHRSLVGELDWENSGTHCEMGANRLESFEPLATFSKPVLYHHTHWQDLKSMDVEDKVKQEANLIYMLDRVDYIGQTIAGPNWLSKRQTITERVRQCRGTYFHPELVDLFCEASRKEAFWLILEPRLLKDFIDEKKEQTIYGDLPYDQVRSVAQLFAQIVDAKSPYTAEHSQGTAALAAFLAKEAGMDQKTCMSIESAGLLHDIGKLNVPDQILDKAAPLDSVEKSIMQHHSYISYQIINKIDGFEDIAGWTANHHEALDGTGYPFRKKADKLDTPSRIIAIADIFQALAQDRPYRSAQPPDKIISFLNQKARHKKLDRGLVALVSQHRVACFEKAVGQD